VQKYRVKLLLLAQGAILLGWLQAAGMVNFNQVWYQLLLGLFNSLIAGFFAMLGINVTPSAASGSLGGFSL